MEIRLKSSDYLYGTASDSYAELETLIPNKGEIVKIYQRLRFDGDVVDGPWVMNETVSKNGDPSVTGIIYGVHEDENFSYLDIEVTGNPWGMNTNLQFTASGDVNGYTVSYYQGAVESSDMQFPLHLQPDRTDFQVL